MPPPPQHKDIKGPPGEPPQSWSIVPTTGGTSNLDSVEQRPAEKESLPAQARARIVEEQQSSRKRSTTSQSSKARALTAKSTQSTASKHVERKPKRRRLLRKDLILVNVIATSIWGAFQGIDGVERKLRTRNVARHKVTPKTQESDPDPGKYQSVNPVAQDGQFRSEGKQNSSKTDRQTNTIRTSANKLSRPSSSKSSKRSGRK
jgi:hypothetical protein